MNRKTGILAAALVILCVAAGILFQMNKPETITGAKIIDVIVIHADQTENTFSYETNAEYLGEVLLENELAEGDITDYGLLSAPLTAKLPITANSSGGASPKAENRSTMAQTPCPSSTVTSLN